MKYLLPIILLIVCCRPVAAQTNDVDWDAVLNTAQQWANSNLDTNVVVALQNVDRDQVKDFLKNSQSYLQGGYVLDLAQFKDTADTALPWLATYDETRPYAAWLKPRLDYFEAAQEMQTVPPPPPVPTTATTNNNASVPAQNPSFQTEQQVWVRQVANRPWPKAAAQYVPKLKPVFAGEGVPEELVWLAEVESGFDARASSPAGAEGMFQLMPATAKTYGLSLWPFDQRNQPEIAAQAAARYLRQLYGQFGDWRLAVAAYNCGPGLVSKILQRYDTHSYERIATHLPAETQMYVPKVEATIRHREGRELEQLKAPGA